MMAQYVGRPRFAPATILSLLVLVHVTQLANAGASTLGPATTKTAATEAVTVVVDDDDVSPRVLQPAVNPAAIGFAVLSHGANPGDDRRAPFVEFLGAGLDHELALRWSSSSRDCPRDAGNALDAVSASSTGDRAIYGFRTAPDAKVTVVYFCLKNGSDEKWSNLGDRVSVRYLARPE